MTQKWKLYEVPLYGDPVPYLENCNSYEKKIDTKVFQLYLCFYLILLLYIQGV